ncbi:hypothetical protein GCM10018790_10270 [Kitasatospora xanthocidica]|uniref:hypothetical protein n=1 Tax=Kitasatospora xanthocidica TaxID=83382 RepID=UPI00167B7079|nr:hypothetical protein [Kitasatospora xanthocidica]GHF34501.1 hypothetical protein GCM10018790_10270 [Kitasatospora xanthocidica]
MPGTVITDLRRRGAVDPGRLLAGPLRGVGLQRLEPGHSTEVAADGVEHALYVTAGSGLAEPPEHAVRRDPAPDASPRDASPDDTDPRDAEPRDPEPRDAGIPLVEGTAVVLPLGTRTVLTAGTAGMEYFHAVLAVPAGRPASPSGDEPA